MRYLLSIIICFTLLIGTSVPSHANIVPNHGFETGNFSSWNVVDPTLGTFVSSASGGSGDYFAAMGATGQLGSISQTLNTIAGTTYTLDYFLASDGATPNEFKVVWGNTTLVDKMNIPDQGYVEYTFQVNATSASSILTFYGRNDNGFLSLDDVSVSPIAVPAPTSMIPLGM